jgi:hypothetical protein
MDLNLSRNINKTEILRQADFFNVCRKCNKVCCREARPPISRERETIIKNYLKNKGTIFENIFENNVYTFPKVIDGGLCIFFNKNTKKCGIHRVKPHTCLAGPITFDVNIKTKKIEWFLKTETICSLAGILGKNQEALHYHLKSAKRELLQLLHEFDAESLQAILKIEEPDTFKIDEDSLDQEILSKLKTTA